MNGVPLCDLVGLNGVLVLEDATRVDQTHSVCGGVAVFSDLALEVEDGVCGLEGDDILLVVGGFDVDGNFRHDDLLCVLMCGIRVCMREEKRNTSKNISVERGSKWREWSEGECARQTKQKEG